MEWGINEIESDMSSIESKAKVQALSLRHVRRAALGEAVCFSEQKKSPDVSSNPMQIEYNQYNSL